MRFKRIELNFWTNKPVLALGADIKNSICFAHKSYAFISQTIGDLQNLENFSKFEALIKSISKRFGIKPAVIAYDLHPEYFSGRYALSALRAWGRRLYGIQHHHAHIASCMADNNLNNQKVIGVVFDGSGFGSDRRLWGGEFLVCDYKGFSRRAHLMYIPLLGAEKAIQQPWRLTCAWLYLALGEKFLDSGIDFTKSLDRQKWFILRKMWLADLNCPLSSSIGRLFDATAALVLGRYKVRFEAEAAIALEQAASRYLSRAAVYTSQDSAYTFKIIKEKDKYILDPAPLFKQIIAELKTTKSQAAVAYKFHLTVAQMIRKMCLILRRDSGISRVVLSGGVFQNKILLRLSLSLLYKEKFKVIIHKRLACNDSSICLGQAVIGGAVCA
jgi:hydrogenase maturation protein HypF